MNLWTWAVRSRAGIATMSIGVLAAAGLATAVPALTANGSDQQPASNEQVYVAPTSEAPATPTEAPAPAPIPAPQAVVTEAPTVQAVTEPSTEAPAPAPVVDPESIGTVGENGYYTPAPPRVNPGEPPVGNIGSSEQFSGPVAPLPGEPGYDGPPVGQPIPKS